MKNWRHTPILHPLRVLHQVGYHLARNHPCRVILSERSESNFFHRDPEWHFVPFDPRFARISTTLRMTRWKKRKAAAVAESRQGKEKGSHFDYLSREWHPQREFAPPCKASDTEAASQCYEPNSATSRRVCRFRRMKKTVLPQRGKTVFGTRNGNRTHNYPLGVFISVRAYLRVGDFLAKQV